MIKLIFQAISTIIISTIIAVLINLINPNGIPFVGDYSREARLRALENKKKQGMDALKKVESLDKKESVDDASELESDIFLKEAFENFNQGGAIFLDSRVEGEFDEGHIPGAINIPADNFEDYKNRFEDIPLDMKIITYCSGTDCDSSIELANSLVDLGYFNVRIFFGGWIEWKNAGYQVEVFGEN